MIYFVTNRNHKISTTQFEIRNAKIGIEMLYNVIQERIELCIDKPLIGLDKETTGLDAYINNVLLVAVGTEQTQFILDATCKETMKLYVDMMRLLLDDIRIIGHNLKFDIKFAASKFFMDIKYMYDTMIVEQRLYQGAGLGNRLDTVLERNGIPIPDAMNKDVRLQFIGRSLTTTFTEEEILYTAGDIAPLFALYRKQKERIEKYKMNFLLYDIEFPLIRVLAKAENEGYVLNVSEEDGWRKIISDNIKLAFELECKLDDIVRELRDSLLTDDDKLYLTGGQWDRKRHPYIDYNAQKDLFGDVMTSQALTGIKKKIKQNPNNTNYGSSDQIATIFGRLGQHLPTKNDNKRIPEFDDKGKVIKAQDGDDFTSGAPALEAFLIVNYDTPMEEFINTLLKYRGCITEINNFGENYIKKVNPVTGKIHTIFRQANAENGRLQSGGGKFEPDKFNSQNVPAKPKFRECFGTDEGYRVITCDLSGAEITVMASKAQDFKLLQLTGEDIHSHMAQKGWRNIYNFRLNAYKNKYPNPAKRKDAIADKINDLTDKVKTFIVSKTVNNASHRKPCKNLTFGSVYGCGTKKAGRTLNISQHEGGIYIETIKSEIPDTFKMVERNVFLALTHGFLILNNRTNSRIWFKEVINAKKNGYDLPFKDKIKVDGQARNIPISGTQADMLKEAMVEIQTDIDKNNWDCLMLGQVHDELIYKFPLTKEYDFFPEYLSNKMCEVANRYLDGVEMGADYEVKLTWTK